MHAPAAQRIDRYVLHESIGAGGMGVVYRAFDPRLRRRLAIKLVSGSADRRLLREAQAMAQLSHPNVVQVYDAGIGDGNQVFIAMELIEGIDLGRWLRSPRGWTEIVDHFVAAGRGLAAAHAAGIVHRDFKPSNVLVSDSGRVLVGDFGLARPAGIDDLHGGAAEAWHGATITLSKGGKGTPRYMAPEQRSGAAVDARADQYSFCVALTEALAATGAPARVLDVARRGLAVDPAQRFGTMQELLAALEAARGGGAARRGHRLWALAAVVAIAAIAVGVPLASGDEPTAQPAAAASPPEPAPMTAPEPEPAPEPDAAPAPAPDAAPAPPEESARASRRPDKKRRRRPRSKKPERRRDPDGLIRDLWGSE